MELSSGKAESRLPRLFCCKIEENHVGIFRRPAEDDRQALPKNFLGFSVVRSRVHINGSLYAQLPASGAMIQL